MNINDFNSGDIIACFFSVLGGLAKFLLNIDDTIPAYKRFILIFVAAMPVGYLSYSLAIDYDFAKAAYPLAFIAGVMALSIVNKIATEGLGMVLKYLERKIK